MWIFETGDISKIEARRSLAGIFPGKHTAASEIEWKEAVGNRKTRRETIEDLKTGHKLTPPKRKPPDSVGVECCEQPAGREVRHCRDLLETRVYV